MQGPSFEFEKTLIPEWAALTAGVDEAGRGALCGPVVAAAVIFKKPKDLPFLNDSKKLTPEKRDELFALIEADPDIMVGIGIVDHDLVDEINVLRATIEAMKKALLSLSIKPAFALIDGLPVDGLPVPHQAVVKGDGLCPSISAASIVAKVVRDRRMLSYDACFPGYGFARHKGYGTKEHIEAINRIGLCTIHRRTFIPCRQPLLF